MKLNITIEQKVVQDFLEKYRQWNGNENTTPYLYFSTNDTSYEAEAHPLTEDAILVSVPLQNFLLVLTEPNNNPYELWFTLIRSSGGLWEQGKHTKVLTFEESMALSEVQNHRMLLLEELRD